MLVYIIAGFAALATAALLWFVWRRWMWDNIFGVCMVSCLGFRVAPLRIQVADILSVEMQEGPSWIVIVVLAILHFLTVNVRPRTLSARNRPGAGGGGGGGGGGTPPPGGGGGDSKCWELLLAARLALANMKWRAASRSQNPSIDHPEPDLLSEIDSHLVMIAPRGFDSLLRLHSLIEASRNSDSISPSEFGPDHVTFKYLSSLSSRLAEVRVARPLLSLTNFVLWR